MKNNIDTEKLLTIFFVIIILGVLIFVAYSIFDNNSKLYNNETQKNNINTNTEPTNETSSNNNSKDETDSDDNGNDLNIDPDKINDISNNNTSSQEIVLSTYTSSIYDRDQNRVDNITLANSKLNGKIVKKGEEFSFNDTIGPMNEQQGFKKAIGFDSKGNKIKISGGGLCQISSTMYNAVLDANLEVTERHAHSRRVYYVPKDRDATILYGSLDFKFKNTSDSDIKIEATNDNTNVVITLKKI